MAAYVLEDDERTVHAADSVVSYPWLDGHHTGVEGGHVGGVDERFVEFRVARGRVFGGRNRRWSSLAWVTKLEVVGGASAAAWLDARTYDGVAVHEIAHRSTARPVGNSPNPPRELRPCKAGFNILAKTVQCHVEISSPLPSRCRQGGPHASSCLLAHHRQEVLRKSSTGLCKAVKEKPVL